MSEMATGGLLSLKWNNHQSTFLHVLSSLCLNDALSDVTLACDGEFYSAHKIVLATCSEYFEKIFEKIEGKHSVIVLSHVKCEELEALLSYMYEGEINVLQEKLSSLIQAAEFLKIKGLSDSDDTPDLFPSRILKRARRRSRPLLTNSSQDILSTPPPPSKRRRSESDDSETSLQIDASTTLDREPKSAFPPQLTEQKDVNNSSNVNQQLFENSNVKEEIDRDLKKELLSINEDTPQFTANQDFGARMPLFPSTKNDERTQLSISNFDEGNTGTNNFWESSASMPGFDNSINTQLGDPNLNRRKNFEHLTVTPDDFMPLSEQQRDEGFVCPYCPFKTYQRTTYEAHVKRHSNEKSFSCQFCSYTTMTKSNLKCHIRKHTGEKPFGCPHCSYRSAQSSNIKIHVRRIHKDLFREDPPRNNNSSDNLIQ